MTTVSGKAWCFHLFSSQAEWIYLMTHSSRKKRNLWHFDDSFSFCIEIKWPAIWFQDKRRKIVSTVISRLIGKETEIYFSAGFPQLENLQRSGVQLSERLASLIAAQLMASWNPSRITTLWNSGVKEWILNWTPNMPRGVSLSMELFLNWLIADAGNCREIFSQKTDFNFFLRNVNHGS